MVKYNQFTYTQEIRNRLETSAMGNFNEFTILQNESERIKKLLRKTCDAVEKRMDNSVHLTCSYKISEYSTDKKPLHIEVKCLTEMFVEVFYNENIQSENHFKLKHPVHYEEMKRASYMLAVFNTEFTYLIGIDVGHIYAPYIPIMRTP